MALSTARIHRVRGRPPRLAAGITSLIHSHSSSVRSLGYVFSFISPCYTTHEDFSDRLLAAPTVLGVIDTYGIELIHPMREGRSPQQIGRKGLSNHRWIVGGKLCLLFNQWGL